MKRFFISVFGCAICSIALSISSAYFLFFASEDDGNGNSDYFGWRVATSCIEITIFILFTIAVFPNEIIAFVRLPSFTSSKISQSMRSPRSHHSSNRVSIGSNSSVQSRRSISRNSGELNLSRVSLSRHSEENGLKLSECYPEDLVVPDVGSRILLTRGFAIDE